MKEKLETITNLFEVNEIRSIWNSDKEDYYFSVVDVIQALTDSKDSRNYWKVLKNRLNKDRKIISFYLHNNFFIQLTNYTRNVYN